MDCLEEAKYTGFEYVFPLLPSLLSADPRVRQMCMDNKCHAYGRNWTCPPACGSIEECQARMEKYRRGILLQTAGSLSKDIDSKGYQDAEKLHMERLRKLCAKVKQEYPDALCLGSGACRVCKTCAYPEPCRHPDQALCSMESHGLFVTQVCRDCGAAYHHGPRTITFTACILY